MTYRVYREGFFVLSLCLTPWVRAAEPTSMPQAPTPTYEMLVSGFYDTPESAEKDLRRLKQTMPSWPLKLQMPEGFPRVIDTNTYQELPSGEFAIAFSVCKVDAPGASAHLKNYVKAMETPTAAYTVVWKETGNACPQTQGKIVSAVMNHTRGQRIIFVSTVTGKNWSGVARWVDSQNGLLSEIDLKGCGMPRVAESGATLVIQYSCPTPVAGCSASGTSDYTMTVTANRDTLTARVDEEQTVPARCSK